MKEELNVQKEIKEHTVIWGDGVLIMDKRDTGKSRDFSL